MPIYDELLIGGHRQRSTGSTSVEVRSPASGEVVGRVPSATPDDVDAAVHAARDALAGPWGGTTPEERIDVLRRWGKALGARGRELAATVTAEVGSPVSWSYGGQVQTALGALGVAAQAARGYPFRETRAGLLGGPVRVRRIPVGVVAAIVPWNAPLFTALLKLGPALAAGCAVVLKPALEAPLSVFALAEAAAEAGLPEGVLSVLPADAATSEYLVRHPDVDKVSFTGSTAVGRRIGELCGADVRSCTLELGGKSAAVLLPDTDLGPATLGALVDGAMANAGQICIAQSRVLVPRERHDEVAEALGAAVDALVVGDPQDPATQVGPVISAAARDRILAQVESGRDRAWLVAGGGPPAGLAGTHYVQPTLFADVDPEDPLAQEEIFGPVLSLIPYQDVDDAVRIANGTRYGLAGSVWTTDVAYGEAVAARLVAGSVAVNSTAAMDLGSPFGGMRSSGLGREGGPEGIDAYVEPQSLVLPAGSGAEPTNGG